MLTLFYNFVILFPEKQKGVFCVGFYDTIGGSQVKCFKYPTLKVDDKTIDIGAECGSFQFFSRGSEVPYRTCYYDFGENFMIFDIRRTFWGENFEGLVHIIENGRYVASEHYTKLSDRYQIYMVIDNYGKPLKIKTKDDFIRIIEEEVSSSKEFAKRTKNYLIQMAAIPMTNFLYIKEEMKKNGWTQEFVLEQIEKNDSARAMAYEDTIEPFLTKWYDYKKQADVYGGIPIGILYSTYHQHPTQYDWNNIINKFQDAAKNEQTTLELQVKNYLKWAEQHCVKTDDDFYQLFPFVGGDL